MESSAPSASATTESSNEMLLADESAEVFNTDELVAIIFSFLPRAEIMRLRRVCTTWRDAAKKTLVPLTKFVVNSVRKCNAMTVMSTALPNLQHLAIRNLGQGRKYSDGEDPDEERAAITDGWISQDIDIISNFSKLRILSIRDAPLSGRYPALLNFPLIQKLTITYCRFLKWDLEMLEGLPSLKELYCSNNLHLTGSLSSLRVLKDTLEKVKIMYCYRIEGNLMDLADFSRLKWLHLRSTNVRGDIRDIGENHFPALESLILPKSVHGGIDYEFKNVSDVPEFMYTIHRLLQRSPDLFNEFWLSVAFDWRLSQDSPDWYTWNRRRGSPNRPFCILFVQAGSRRGWSWCTLERDHSCEINWLDPEPSNDSSEYAAYIEELQHIERRIDFYRGYYEPPTEEEYHRLV